jgi:hypothetical protein
MQTSNVFSLPDGSQNDGIDTSYCDAQFNLTLGFAISLSMLHDKRILSLCETSEIVVGYNEGLEPIEKA